MREDLTVRGTRDYYPEVYSRLGHIMDAWRRTALAYGFEEFDGPVIETLDLYRIKSGDEITGQLYHFTDKGGRELALRPELTPTVARMVAKILREAPKPIKWFSIPRCFRYEKPQKGRLREFFQFNVDIIGEEEGLSDVETMGVAIDSLLRLGLKEDDFVVKINNRDFVSVFFRDAGIGEKDERELYKIIDNAPKVPPEVTDERIGDLGIDGKQKQALDEYLGIKNIEDLERMKYSNPGKESLLAVFSHIQAAGFGPYCALDVTVVRGLDYYTGTVYEIFDKGERMRAICGGGRYNHLLREFGGLEVPACGFGMGDVVLGDILEKRGLLPEYEKKVDYFLVRISEDQLPVLLETARTLRKKGHTVEYAYRPTSVKKQMAKASKAGAASALIFGREEMEEKSVRVKDLRSGEEKTLPLADIFAE
ncbi:MAG: histidine--tRNA ligase [Spirochaetes bacterium]|nr:histidine--tRNA ligase [Spirochaetota bacterium]